MIDMTKALVKPVRTWVPTGASGNTSDYIFLASDGWIYDIEGGVIHRNFGYTVGCMVGWTASGLFEEVAATFGEGKANE